MNFRRSTLILLLILVLLVFCAESECKKWRSHQKKNSNSPKISATFRTVSPKRKSMPKHLAAAHKRNAKMNYYHPLPTSWPTHFSDTLPSTYYLASNYPRWRSYLTTPARRNTFRKMDLIPPFVPLLPFGAHPTAMRRADEFDFNSSSALSTAPLVDMSAFNAALSGGIFDADLSQSSANRDFLQPQISLGGWTPVDYKSFMADAEFSLLNDHIDLSRGLEMNRPLYSNPFETHFV